MVPSYHKTAAPVFSSSDAAPEKRPESGGPLAGTTMSMALHSAVTLLRDPPRTVL